MRVAVTGGMGFIGTEVVSRLIIKGHDVVVVDFWSQLIQTYEKRRYPILETTYANLTTADDVLTPYEFLDEHCKNVDVIVHLGAVVDTMNICEDDLVKLNVDYTRALVSKLRSPIVFASSASVYGTKGYPNNPYGLTKTMGERIIRDEPRFNSDHTILRFFNVFGRHEHHKGKMASVPFKLSQAYNEGRQFELHSPDAARDFVPVAIVADLIVSIVELYAGGDKPLSRTYDVGSGSATTFEDLNNFIMQAKGATQSIVKNVPMPPELVGRYQGWTKAGLSVQNMGACSTREWLEKYYGKS